jgi:ABC-type Fe3+-hydroxamate transport system substrate-binding protein
MILLIAALAALAVLVAGCGGTSSNGGPSAAKQAADAIKQRTQSYEKAKAQTPTPNITNFPRRKTLADAVVRQSLPNHPWYVYVLGQNGNIVNYFVAKSVPVNDCDYLSNDTEIVSAGDNGNDGSAGVVTIPAPDLEGIYQSGSGCNTLTFFDLGTNAEVQVTAIGSYITDRPLKVDAAPVKIRSGK